jgi:hypothetical protein
MGRECEQREGRSEGEESRELLTELRPTCDRGVSADAAKVLHFEQEIHVFVTVTC